MTPRHLLSLAALLFLAAGCSTGHHSATNRLGTVHATLAAPPARVTQAAEEVLQEMNIPITASAATAIDGRVEGESARDKKISISVKLKGDAASHVTIRHGTLGDENISVTILQRIEAKLGLSTDPTMDATPMNENAAASPATKADETR